MGTPNFKKLKRIHLFEFEDQSWFPGWLRECLTNMLIVFHKALGTKDTVAGLLDKILKQSPSNQIIDLCSGGGGPMPDVLKELKEKYGYNDVKLVLTDLYPNTSIAEKYNSKGDGSVTYKTESVDATNVGEELKGIRAMLGSFHHMTPENARHILQSAMENKQAICIHEPGNNAMPTFLWWLVLPFNIITALVVSLFTRPFTFQQFFFTYIIPIIPICFAWDGAVSNVRIYTVNDMNILLEGLELENYTWETGTIKGKSKQNYLLGYPI